MLADDFFRPVSFDLHGPFIPGGNPAGYVQAHNGVVFDVSHQQAKPFLAFAYGQFGVSPLGKVADCAGHQRAFFRFERTDADLDRKFIAILVESEQLDDAALHPMRARLTEKSLRFFARLTEASRNQNFRLLADQLPALVAKQPIQPRVDKYDPAFLARHHHGVRSPFQQPAESLFGSLQSGNIAIDFENTGRLSLLISLQNLPAGDHDRRSAPPDMPELALPPAFPE